MKVKVKMRYTGYRIKYIDFESKKVSAIDSGKLIF